MKFFPSRKVFLSIGSVSIRWYAILILAGIVVAYILSKKDAKKFKYLDHEDYLDDFIFLVLWVGILGARIWFCLFFNFDYYFHNPIEILKIYDGGLAIQGGVMVGIIAGYFFCKKRHTSFMKTLDCVLPNVLIAQAFGRWGNFVNQECHGPVVPEAYFDKFPTFIKEGMFIGGEYYMPMFLYESIACLIGFVFIRYLVKRFGQRKRGDLAWCYLMWYGIVRLYIESLRTDALMIGNFKIAQIISIIFVVLGVLGYMGVFEKLFKPEKPTIIFDFDGTLVDTDASILGAFEELYRLHDDVKNFTDEKRNYVLGPALRESFPVLFPGLDVDMLIDEYHDAQEKLLHLNKPAPNAEKVLKTLKDEGYNIGILSTRSKDGIELRLDKLNLSQYIDGIYGLNEVVNLKPDPEGIFGLIKDYKWNKDDVIYVGDSLGDVGAGYNYGAYTVAYISRESRRKELEESNANVCIDNFDQLLDIVKEKHYFTYNLK